MSIALQTITMSDHPSGPTVISTLKTDASTIQTEANRVALKVDPQHKADGNHGIVTADSVTTPSVTLGGVQRTTWPAAGSATQSLSDVLANGQIGTLPAGVQEMGINDQSGNSLSRVNAYGDASMKGLSFSAISQSIHSGAIVKAILYDTSKDSDGGAWRKRCAGKSWYTETLGGTTWLGQAATAAAAWALPGAATGNYFQNTTDGKFYTLGASSPTVSEVFRGNAREFPEQVAIIAETGRVIFYDLTQAVSPMWMVFVKNPTEFARSLLFIANTTYLNCIAAFNGRILIGFGRPDNAAPYYGYVADANFISDVGYADQISGAICGNIANRNTTLYTLTDSRGWVTNGGIRDINDISIIVLDGAPIDPVSRLPIPTIALASMEGVRVILQDGTVSNITFSGLSIPSIAFDKSNAIISSLAGATTVWRLPYPWPASTSNPPTGSTYLDGATIPAVPFASGKKVIPGAYGSTALILHKDSSTTPANGMVAYLTNAYNSGWLPGDIRGAWLADTVVETKTGGTDTDRSVKANNLVVNGAIVKTAVASGAQLVTYSGYSAANYLSQVYSANLDFGTGDFSVMGWLTEAPNSALEYIFNRDSATPGKAIRLWVSVAGFLVFELYDGTTTRTATGTVAVDDSAPKLVNCNYSAGTLTVYVNGVSYATATGAALLTLTNASAITRIGYSVAGASPLTNGSLALWRVAAYAPSADQIAHIYRTELALFQAGAQCTLDGSSTAVTALAYDDTADVLHVGTSWGRSAFRDLLRIESSATTTGAITALSAGQGTHITGGATGGRYYQPAMLLRDELRRRDEARRALGKVPVFFDFDAVTSQVAFVLPKGYTTKAVYSAGTLKRLGATKDYTTNTDGFAETVTFGTAPGNTVWVSVMAVRNY